VKKRDEVKESMWHTEYREYKGAINKAICHLFAC
jgi:hypothetical protein